MQRLIKSFLIFAAIVFVGGNVNAATINASSCSQAHVQAAVDSASSGDIVNVPAGSCTWSSGVSIGKIITLQGAGKTSTVITMSSDFTAFSITGAMRVSGFGFVFTGSKNNATITATGKGWRIDNCAITHSVGGYGIFARASSISAADTAAGVIDNCDFVDARIFISGTHTSTQGQNDEFFEEDNLGSGDAVYIENSTFNRRVTGNVIDSNYGGRWVARFNYGLHMEFMSHGISTATGGLRGTRSFEIYNNTFHSTGAVGGIMPIFLRGGVGVIFDNAITGTWAWSNNIRLTSDRSLSEYGTPCDGTSPMDGNVTGQSGWLCRDQSAAGRDSVKSVLSGSYPNYTVAWGAQIPTPVYAWGNSTAITTNAPDHIKANRDYYDGVSSFNGTVGTGSGTLANRPATCTTGVGYWATDQGNWNKSGSGGQGVLYKCTSTNTWTSYYTPYEYPHPLRTGGTTPPVTQAPVANFVGSPVVGTAPLTVNFTDLSTNTPTSWGWNFGDGTTSTQQNPSKTYNIAGTYTVALSAANAGGSNTNTKTNYVTVTVSATNAIKPYPDNPRYWQYKDAPVVLIGGTDDENIFNNPGIGPSGIASHLDLLALNGGNYVHNIMSARDIGNVQAFGSVGGVYNLSTWNNDYWTRFENLLSLSQARDIIVQLSLWDVWDSVGAAWDASPWNPKNNSNYTAYQSGLPESVVGSSSGSFLTGSAAEMPSSVNLTTEGVADWAHWGLVDSSSVNRKSGITPKISNFTRLGVTSPIRFSSASITYSWSDGTPTANVAGTNTGLAFVGIGNGYQLTAPADTTNRALKIYLSSWKSKGRLEVSLLDGSSPPYVLEIENPDGNIARVVTINYASASQSSLVVKFTMVSGLSDVTLQAVTLTESEPPPEGETFIPTTPQPFFNTVPALGNNTVVLPYQQAFINKLMSTSLKYPNVLYCINNESIAANAWSDYWAQYIKNIATASGATIQVSDMKMETDILGPNNTDVMNKPVLYDFMEYSQNNYQEGQTHWDKFRTIWDTYMIHGPKPSNNAKTHGNISGGVGGDHIEGAHKLWRNIFNGMASSRFVEPYGLGLTYGAEQIKSMRMLLDDIDFKNGNPQPLLLSNRASDEAYLFAKPGSYYAVYFTNGGSVGIDLSALSGFVTLKWLKPDISEWTLSTGIQSGGVATLEAPDSGSWVALITNEQITEPEALDLPSVGVAMLPTNFGFPSFEVESSQVVYVDNFSLRDVGSSPIGLGWTRSFFQVNPTSTTIVSTTTPPGWNGRAWRLESTPVGSVTYQMNEAPVSSITEVLLLVRRNTVQTSGAIVRISGNAAYASAYSSTLNIADFEVRTDGNSYSLSPSTPHNISDIIGKWCWLRVRMENNVLYSKGWEYGISEPSTWQSQRVIVSPIVSEGLAGIHHMGAATANSVDYAYYAVGVHGASPTLPVVEVPALPPVANFYCTPVSGAFPLLVSCFDQSTNGPTSWSWDLGNGTTSTSKNPSLTYATAGTYTVTLTAVNAYGSNQSIKTNYITVTVPPVSTFTETHYVTQAGAGTKTGRTLANAWALSDFHNTSNWSASKAVDSKIGPDDVVYLSGTFTDRVLVSKGGSSAGSVTLDGYAAGDTDPLQSINTNAALLQQGMEFANAAASIEYVTVQDFRMTDPLGFRATLNLKGGAPSWSYPLNRLLIRRNYIYNSGERFLTFFYGKYNIIVDNKFYTFGLANDPANDRYVQGALSLIEFSNSLFARNEVGHDGTPIQSAPNGSPELVHTHGCQNLLMEYNDLYGTPGQSGLRPKEHPVQRPPNYNHVIRFNKVHDNPHSQMGKGIYINTRATEPISHFYVYGNYIYKNGTMGFGAAEGTSHVYAWANILAENGRHGISVYDTTATSSNFHFYNNTIVRNNRTGETDVARGGIVITSGAQNYIKNNILWNNRPAGETSRLQIASWITLSGLEHNSYFHSLGDPMLYYASGYRTLATMKSSYGFENVTPAGIIENPLFSDPNGIDNIYATDDDNYQLTSSSPVRNNGKALAGSFSVNLSGGDAWFQTQTGYGTITFGLDDALDPANTDWTTTPPTVSTVKQGSTWSRGAYVYR